MKNTLIIVFMLFSAVAFTQVVEINKKLDLASMEFMTHHKIKKYSTIVTMTGIGFMALGMLQKDDNYAIYIGSATCIIGFTINLTAQKHFKRGANHLKSK